MSYLSRWEVRLIINGGAETVYNPRFEGEPDFVFSDAQEDSQVFYRKKMTTEFYLTDQEYLTFQGLVTSCPTIEVKFYYSSVLRYQGTIQLDSCTFDLDIRRVKLVIQIEDSYECILKLLSVEENIFQTSASPVTVKTIAGVVTTCAAESDSNLATAITDPDLGPLPCGDSRLVTSLCPDCQDQTITAHKVISLPSNKWLYQETYGREELTVSCATVGSPAPATLPGGYNLLTDDCAGSGNAIYTRALTTVFDSLNSTGTTGGAKDFIWKVVGLDLASEIPNGRSLSSLLVYFFNKCGKTVESNALSISPVETPPSNQFYNWAAIALANLTLHQLTDVKNPDAAQAASQQDISLGYILDLLRDTFQIYWALKNDTTVVIEHITYFQGGINENLLVSALPFVQYKNTFTVEPEEQPRFERFAWLIKTLDPDFDGLPIEYTCFDANDKDKEYSPAIATNISQIFNNPGQYPDSGFAMSGPVEVVPGTLVIISVTQVISGLDKYNGYLTWAEIHRNAWIYDRYQGEAKINGSTVTTIDPKRKRLQEPFTYFKETTDYFGIDFNGLYITFLGQGKVKQATYSSSRKELTLELKHGN